MVSKNDNAQYYQILVYGRALPLTTKPCGKSWYDNVMLKPSDYTYSFTYVT